VSEPRGQLRLAQEALDQGVSDTQSLVQHLDDDLTAERWLFAAIRLAETALADPLAKDEAPNSSPKKLVSVCHLQEEC
jgi:hypothetical protein